MKWVYILLLFIGSSAYATDPLGLQFFPSIDQNPSHYSTSFGTITITDSLYKVFQSSVAPGNVHWAIVYSMQNEIQSFQVHVSPSVNISSLSVTMSNLTNAQTGTVISSATTDIIVYREFYMNISTPTSLSTMTYYGGMRAMMPNQLIQCASEASPASRRSRHVVSHASFVQNGDDPVGSPGTELEFAL